MEFQVCSIVIATILAMSATYANAMVQTSHMPLLCENHAKSVYPSIYVGKKSGFQNFMLPVHRITNDRHRMGNTLLRKFKGAYIYIVANCC